MRPGALFFLLSFLLVIISPDQPSMAYAALALYFVIKLFWRENEPKNLFVCMVIYWLTVSLLAPYGAIFGFPLTELSEQARETIKYAHFLSLTAMISFALGVHIVVRNLKGVDRDQLAELLKKYDGLKLFWGYVAYSIVARFLGSLFLGFSGGQLLIGFIYFKWVFLALLIIHTLIFPSNKKYVFILIAIELLLSFSGFWASYKDYILVAVAAFFTLTQKINFRNILVSISIFTLTFFVSVIWSFSKGEYRRYLTGGERSQYVVKNDQLENILHLREIVVRDFSPENFSTNFQKGVQGLLYRVSYIEYFSMSLKHVPTFIPYENGQLLFDAFEHVFKPRILFPNKKPVYDSEITSKYTGRLFSGSDVGVSFSLGTVPERYIDFGAFYMFIPIFFFGVWIGFMYRYMVINGYNILWGLCYTAPFFQFMIIHGLATTKFLGWSVTYFIILFLINKYLIKYLDRWLLKKEYQ